MEGDIRPMNEIALFLIFLVLGFSVLLLAISAASAVRVRSTKTSLLALAFLFFFLKEVYLLYLELFTSFRMYDFVTVMSIMDVLVLFFFYASVLK